MHFDRLNAAFVPERLVNIGPGTQLFVNLKKNQKTTCITTSRFSYFSIGPTFARFCDAHVLSKMQKAHMQKKV